MSKDETISLGCLAKELGESVKTVRQMCETEQIPESAYFIADKGSKWEMPIFYKAKVFKALDALKEASKEVPKEVPKEAPKSVPKKTKK